MRRDPSTFLNVRRVALYLMSLAAVYGSSFAWRPERATEFLEIGWPPLALGTAAIGGAAIHGLLAGLADRHARARLRSVVGIVYGGVLLLVSLGLLMGARDAVDAGGSILRGLQPAFLLLAGFGRGHLGTLVNAFALTATSILAGGAGAAVAVTMHGGLVVFFLAADHTARKLTEYPVDEMPPAGPILARGGVQAVAIAAGLAAFFWVFPAAPYAPLQRTGAITGLSPDRLAGLLGNLLLVGILSAVGFYMLLRMGFGRSPDSEEPVIQIVQARRRSQKAGDLPYVEPVELMQGWRGRIVKLYVRTTEQLAKWGRRRRSFQTPCEFGRTLAPPGAAAELTDLFGRARYGPEEMTEADFQNASRACREILDHHRRPAL